jgi:pilus assembly protein CpaB
MGRIIKPEDLRWQAWPQTGLAETYVVQGKRSLDEFAGAVARAPIAAGDPITEGKLVMAGARGFLAAVLQPGMRAVSVPITATSAVSGFIYAGDRVDVLLTHILNRERGGQHSATETILRNARVIAMDQKLEFNPGDKPDVGKTATLELTPKQTEIVTLAVKMGDLSLVLRSLQDLDEEGRDPTTADGAPAEPGDSYTHDTQVSRLIRPVPSPVEPPRLVFVLRGSERTKQELDGGGKTNGATDDKADAKTSPRTTTFTRTFPSVQQ